MNLDLSFAPLVVRSIFLSPGHQPHESTAGGYTVRATRDRCDEDRVLERLLQAAPVYILLLCCRPDIHIARARRRGPEDVFARSPAARDGDAAASS